MSILHFCMIDQAYLNMPFIFAKSSFNFYLNGGTILTNYVNNLTNSHSYQNMTNSTGNLSLGSTNSTGNNMSSMVGNAISVIPGTTLINNLFGRVFTSGDNSGVRFSKIYFKFFRIILIRHRIWKKRQNFGLWLKQN